MRRSGLVCARDIDEVLDDVLIPHCCGRAKVCLALASCAHDALRAKVQRGQLRAAPSNLFPTGALSSTPCGCPWCTSIQGHSGVDRSGQRRPVQLLLVEK